MAVDAEFAQAIVQGKGNNLSVVHGDDSGLIVEFYMEPVLQGAESEKEGRRIYKDVPFIWIRFVGDRTREVRRKVDLKGRNGIPDPERFPRQWQAFQRKTAPVAMGTPIEQWGPIDRSQALTLKGVNIHTVENLAAVPDTALHNLGHGARVLRDKAIAWLKAAGDSAETTRLAAENQHLKDELAALKEQVAELAARKKPGPKARVADEQE